MAGIEKGVGFPITAIDQFSAVFGKLAQQTKGAQDHVSKLNGFIAAMTAGLGAAGIAALVKNVIDAHDEVNKLSQRLGVGVGALSQFKYAAELSDVSMETLSAGVKGLSQRMIEAGDSSTKAGRLMAAMGVDVRGGTLPAIEKMADVFRQLPDGPTKAALAVEVFGRSGMEMIPLLNQGSDGIRLMREEADKLGITMSESTAAAAEQFNDNLRAVRAAGESLGMSLLNAVAPSLVAITKAMKDAAIEGGVFKGVLEGLREAWSQAFLGDPVQNRIKAIRDELALLEPMLAEAPGLTDRVTELNRELRGLLSFQDGVAGSGGKPAAPGAPGSTSAAVEDLYRKILGQGTAAEKTTKAMKDLGLADAHVTAYLKNLNEEQERTNVLLEHRARLVREAQEEEVDAINARDDMLDRLEQEVALLKMSELERQKYLDDLEEERLIKLALTDADEDRIKALIAERRALRDGQEVLRAQASIWNEVSDLAGSFFSDLVMNGRDAFDNLKRFAKDLLAQMIALFAKRWVLNLAAGGTMLGSAGSALAGGAGDGSMAGGLLNFAGSASGLGALLPGGAVGTAFGNVAQMGAGLLGASGSLGSAIGMAFSWLPAIGAGIALVGMIASMFDDGPENTNFRWLQGQGGSGLFGGVRSTGNYNFDTSGPLSVIGNYDQRLARILGPEGTAAATAGLSAYTAGGRRMDGQPAEFGIPEGADAAAIEQITKEVLQSRYSIIFAQIDSTIADTIRNWTGTATELQTYIETAIGVVEGLEALNVRGLNVTTLQLMSRAGETLADTFNRVANTWNWFQQNFYTDAERLEMATNEVNSVFADLGIAVPGSLTEFRELVNGIDLSTEAGRTLWNTLMAVAPAFLLVEQSADSATDATEDLSAALEEQAELQRRIADSVRQSREAQLQAVIGARGGLQDFLNRTLLDSSVTTLTPQERLAEARKQYEQILLAARAGDLGAAGQLGGAADTYLRIARELYASSGKYVDIFSQVTGDVRGVDDRLAIDQRILEATLGMAATMTEVRDLLIDIRDGNTENTAKIAGAMQRAPAVTRR